MTAPTFSIVTPSFNQGAYIEKTIDSVLSQGYPNLDFIIIDGGSKDNTVEIIKKYERYLTYWVSEADRGQSHAINKGMRLARGEYLTWLNSDDCYLPGALKTMSEMFAADKSVDVVVGTGRIIDIAGKETYRKEPTAQISLESLYGWLDGGDFMQPSSAFHARAWNAVGGLNERIHIALDVDLWLRMAKAGSHFAVTTQLLSEALSHPDAKTTAFRELMRLDCALVVMKHGGDIVARRQLDKMMNQLAWYRGNYESVVNNPLIRLLRPVVKRFARHEGEYWKEKVPPWIKES